MNDPYPPNLEIEIDRPRLRTYLRVQWLACWLVVCSIFGVLFGASAVSVVLEHPWSSRLLAAAAAVSAFLFCLAICETVAILLYYLLSHRLAARFAEELQVTVEGPYLRVRQSLIARTDRKLHFRAIVDYATVQDPLMRWLGIDALQMTTTAGGQSSTLKVPAVKDCLAARDVLSEIDRLRENLP